MTTKSKAKCKYYNFCCLYNNNVLSEEIEKRMCGKGEDVVEDYVPEISLPSKFNPVQDYEFEAGGTCDAFVGYEKNTLIKAIVQHIKELQELLEQKGYL